MEIQRGSGASLRIADLLPERLRESVFARPARRKPSSYDLDDSGVWRRNRDEELQDATDTWLYSFYERVSKALAGQFADLRDKAATQFATLRAVGREVGVEIDKPTLNEIREVAATLAWEPVARAVTLPILDLLVSTPGEPQFLAADELAKRAFATNPARVCDLAALSEADAYIATGVAASELCRSDAVALRYRRRYLTIHPVLGDHLYAVTTEKEPAALFDVADVEVEPRDVSSSTGERRFSYALAGAHIRASALSNASRWYGTRNWGSLALVTNRKQVTALSYEVAKPDSARHSTAPMASAAAEHVVIHSDAPLQFHRLGDAYVVAPGL